MFELLTIMAKEMPEPVIIEGLEKALAAYKLDPADKKARGELGMYCTLYTVRHSSEGRDTMDVIKDMQKTKNIVDTFRPLEENVG